MSRAHVSKCKRCFNVKSLTHYFHVKTKIFADFQICIRVPLKICEIAQENNFIKKRLQHRCFPVKFCKFLKAPILKNTFERLLLPFLGFTKLNLPLS